MRFRIVGAALLWSFLAGGCQTLQAIADRNTASTAYSSSETDLGNVTIVKGLSQSAWVEFNVPPNAISFVIETHPLTAKDDELADWLVSELQDPLGKRLKVHSRASFPNVGTFMFPLDGQPLRHISSGRYRFKLRALEPATDATRTARVKLQVKTAEIPKEQEGVLDVRIYLTGSYGLTAETFRGSVVEKQLAGLTSQILNTAKIKMRIVEVLNANSRLQDIVLFFIPPDQPRTKYLSLEELWPVVGTLKHDQRVLNVVFVSSVLADTSEADGISMGAPVHSQFNTIFVSNKPREDDPDNVLRQDPIGAVTAHEIGHALGLFHLIEVDGNLQDPWSDTMLGTGNVMQTNAGWTGRFTFSPQQTRVMQRSLLIQ
jgi:hypothetical protein